MKYKRQSKITVSHSNNSSFESANLWDKTCCSVLSSEESDEMAKLLLWALSFTSRKRSNVIYKLKKNLKPCLVSNDCLLHKKNCLTCKS